MHVFETIIALLLCGAGLAALARKWNAPYPALVALAGAVLAILPFTPSVLLDPNLALALFVAPVLLDSAFDASQRDMRANWRPIAGLALGAVVLTVLAVALVARALVPGTSWAVAIALGAIVAPPDAAAAIAVLRSLQPPHRILVILEGESLFNDASALLIYRLAAGAAVAASVNITQVVPAALAITAGSVVLGYLAVPVILKLNSRVREVSTAIILQFCGTFAIWLLAESLHLSGILTTVVFAMGASRRAAEITPARIRIPSFAVWETVVFVLNVLAFILIGLQLKPILSRLTRPALIYYTLVAAAICATAIVARLVWVMSVTAWGAWRCRKCRPGERSEAEAVALPPRAAMVVGWCGMRGIVTLAAALALPGEFPHRDLILFTAFAVVLGTLVLQGLTLGPIIRRLELDDDNFVDGEIRMARVEALRAALAVAASSPGTPMVEVVRHRYTTELRRAHSELESPDEGLEPLVPTGSDVENICAAIAAERNCLVSLRARGVIGDAAFQRLEQELDWRELDLLQFVRSEQLT